MSELFEEVKLQFNSRTMYIDIAQVVGEKLFETLCFNQEQIYWMSIALREAVNNAVKHGNKDNSDKTVYIDFQIYPDKLRILVKDEGEGFDAKTIPDPTEEENILKTSGRGIFFIRSFMDELEILNNDKNGTMIALTKYRKEK